MKRWRSVSKLEDRRLWKMKEDRFVPLPASLSCSENRMRRQPMAG